MKTDVQTELCLPQRPQCWLILMRTEFLTGKIGAEPMQKSLINSRTLMAVQTNMFHHVNTFLELQMMTRMDISMMKINALLLLKLGTNTKIMMDARTSILNKYYS